MEILLHKNIVFDVEKGYCLTPTAEIHSLYSKKEKYKRKTNYYSVEITDFSCRQMYGDDEQPLSEDDLYYSGRSRTVRSI